MRKQRINILICFLLVYAVFIILSLNRHSHTQSFNYHSEIFADKAGYNVYLPSLFIYNFSAKEFPAHIDVKTGKGFFLDSISDKVITKYPYGVSLLQSPFWLLAHTLSDSKDGYSSYYQKSVDFAGCFYLTVGLFFLFFLFKQQHTLWRSIFYCLLVILSSGIFYYGIFETGMSHIYSFCCLSILLYLFFNKNNFNQNTYILLIAILSSIYLIIRPINALFLLPIVAYFLFINHESFLNRNSIFNLTRNQVIIIAISCILLIMPQFIYYKYAFGNFFVKSYQNEPFEIPTFSRILELLFSPNNGLLIYYPVCLLLILYSLYSKHKIYVLLIGLFVIYTLIYGSWWSLSLGCGFGHRAMNDIILIFFIPLFIFTEKPKKWLILTILALAIVNFKFIFSYDTCLYTSTNWDFTEYASILFGEFK